MYQAEIFVDGGRTFANQARSAAGIPQVAVVHGSSTAGGAYLPGLSDYVIMVRGRSSIYLAGPPLVKAAIGEDATDDELGGARCTPASPAWASTWPTTTRTPSPGPRADGQICPGTSAPAPRRARPRHDPTS